MIPWVREKFAERRAKWHAARSKRLAADKDSSPPPTPPPTPRVVGEINARSRPLPQRYHGPPRLPIPDTVPTTTTTVVTAETPALPSPLVRLRRTPPSMRFQILKNGRRSCSSEDVTSVTTQVDSSDELAAAAHKERIVVRVICPTARILLFRTEINKRLSELKNEVLLELSDDAASMPLFAADIRQLSPRYRLFRAEYTGAELSETQTITQLNIKDQDSLILAPRRQYLQQMSLSSRDTQGPLEHDIEVATKKIPLQTVNRPMVDINEIFQQSNLQFDVRKVLISLAQASAAIIGAGPYAVRLIAMLKQRLVNKRDYQNDTLQCLIDMGFKRERAEYALQLHNGVYSTALEWLIARQSEEMPVVNSGIGLQRSASVISPSGILTTANHDIIGNTEALLDIVRIYSHREIPPTMDAVDDLVEMGFEKNDVLVALKKTCNNRAAACEWLVGNRSGSLVELREGLAQDSPILKVILEMPQVQMNLSNPKILLAFLSILENENSIRVWGGDNDTSSVITHILQKYHEEKHVLGINQFYTDQ